LFSGFFGNNGTDIDCLHFTCTRKLMKIRRNVIDLLKNSAADSAVLMTAELIFYI
jgi:hypothetical protein